MIAWVRENTIPTPNPTHVTELWITATVAIATAQTAGATAKAIGATHAQIVEATASRAMANSAKATAIAIEVPLPTAQPPDFILTTIAETTRRSAEQTTVAAVRQERASRCGEADALRAKVATADAKYARQDVSIGELSAFAPREATYRAEHLETADNLCWRPR